MEKYTAKSVNSVEADSTGNIVIAPVHDRLIGQFNISYSGFYYINGYFVEKPGTWT